MEIISVINQKGGVGKTTTVVNIGHKLAMEGCKVLILDADSQGNVAESLGMEPSPGMYDLLVGGKTLDGVTLSTSRENLYVVPGNNTTAAAKQVLATRGFAEFVLQKALRGQGKADAPAGKYDVVLVDMAPSLDILHVAAMVASDHLLMPVKLDHLALVGVTEVATTMQEVRETMKSLGVPFRCTLLGILPTFYERNTRASRAILESLRDAFPSEVMMPVIPQDTKLREAPAAGKTIWEYAPQSRGAVGMPVSGERLGGYEAAAEWLKEKLGL